MGTYGYAGLVNLGQLPITVGSKTQKHTVMISEEANFDVVLGRSWMEKMAIKCVSCLFPLAEVSFGVMYGFTYSLVAIAEFESLQDRPAGSDAHQLLRFERGHPV